MKKIIQLSLLMGIISVTTNLPITWSSDQEENRAEIRAILKDNPEWADNHVTFMVEQAQKGIKYTQKRIESIKEKIAQNKKDMKKIPNTDKNSKISPLIEEYQTKIDLQKRRYRETKDKLFKEFYGLDTSYGLSNPCDIENGIQSSDKPAYLFCHQLRNTKNKQREYEYFIRNLELLEDENAKLQELNITLQQANEVKKTLLEKRNQ